MHEIVCHRSGSGARWRASATVPRCRELGGQFGANWRARLVQRIAVDLLARTVVAVDALLDRVRECRSGTIATVICSAQQSKAGGAFGGGAVGGACVGGVLEEGERRGEGGGGGVALSGRADRESRIEGLGNLAGSANVFVGVHLGLVGNLGGRGEAVVVVREDDGKGLVAHGVGLALGAGQARVVAQRLERVEHGRRVGTVDFERELDRSARTVVVVLGTRVIAVCFNRHKRKRKKNQKSRTERKHR